jgi:uncharacterized phage-like protein YoqJ
MKACCFSGHRPDRFPWGQNEEDEGCRRLKAFLKEEIEQACRAGYTHFIAGGATGVDTWAAEIVREMKRGPGGIITLEIALPFECFNSGSGTGGMGRQKKIRDAADKITIVSTIKRTHSFYERNRYMVDQSRRLIAVFDERAGIRGGTFQTIRYAKMKGIEVRQINWITLTGGGPETL